MAGADPAELAQLLQRCGLRDRSAFRALYQAVAPQLYGLVLRIVRSEPLAADVVHDAFVKIWQRAGDYRPGRGSPFTWMATVARNRAIDCLRSAHRSSPHLSLDVPAAPELMSPEPDPGQQWAELEGRRLRECLERLSPAQRQAIALAYLRGLTHEEIAGHVDQPLGTVKSWIRRGLIRLRDCLAS